ncbi:hypothetical protein SUGI_0866190 [Cryptomeria japonica]|nr:hypothetical protein SUGI_0866190 [Cryptomeria japonica]
MLPKVLADKFGAEIGMRFAFLRFWKIIRIENSAVNLADSFQQNGLPFKSRKAPTGKRIQVLEFVGKETIDLLATDTGIDIEKDEKDERERLSKVKLRNNAQKKLLLIDSFTFVDVLSSWRSWKVCPIIMNYYGIEQEQDYWGKIKLLLIECSSRSNSKAASLDGGNFKFDKGKNVDSGETGNKNEMKIHCDASVSKAAEMAVGFTATFEGLYLNEIV